MSKAYGTLPSVLYGITQQPTAFYFDRAVYVFGRRLEMELDAAAAGKKSERRQAMARTMVLHKWLGATKFRDPKG